LVAILIGCLGLYGLTSSSIEQRIKEIGIRKVLGASISQILSLLSKETTVCILIANVISFPLALYGMNKWLEDFAYRIEITWWMFALSGGIALVIALATVSFQAIKAARANPVESLKYE
jgi:putative ABC transport system permease protein